MRLLNRTTLSVAPATAGARLHTRLAPAMEELNDIMAEATATGVRPAGVLQIKLPRTAAVSLIASRPGRFHLNYPEIVLDLVVQDSLANLVSGRFDAGMRNGEHLEKSMIAVRLASGQEMLAVASPDDLARHGTPRTPADLHHHSCLNWRWPTEGS